MAKQTKGFSKFVLMAAFFSGAALLLPSLVSACTNCGICENPCQGINNCYFVEFNDYLQPIGHPQHISSMDASVNLPFSGDYDTTTCFYENSGAVQKYEEYNVFVDSVKIGSTEDPDVVGYYKQNLSEHNFSSGNHIVKVEHRWNFSEVINSQVTSQSAHVKNVVFVLMSANNPPYANAGPDKTVNETQTVILDGSGSYDPDGDTITYLWSCAGGTLSNNSVQKPLFNAPSVSADTNFTCALTVTDTYNATGSDFALIKVKNTSPNIEDPAVQTNPATNIDQDSAVLNGDLTDLGGDDAAEVWFEWGKTTSYSYTTSKQSKSSVGTFAKGISGLQSNTLYHFRAVAENESGIAYGVDKTFRTTADSDNEPPVADAGSNKTVDEGEEIRLDGTGSYDPDGDDLEYDWTCQSGSLAYQDTERPRYTAPYVNNDRDYICTLTVTDEHGENDSDDVKITVANTDTNNEPVELQTESATSIGETQATLRGTLSNLGDNDSVAVWFEWGKTTSYGKETAEQTKTSTGLWSKVITGLSEDTTYHFRAIGRGEDDNDIVYGQDKTFTTLGQENDNGPVADAGPDKTVNEGEQVRLDGSGSYDPDNGDIDYYWTCASGTLSSRTVERPYYTAPEITGHKTYTCTLKVTDEDGLTDTDEANVAVNDDENQTSDLIDIKKQAMNLSRGDTAWSDAVIASSSDVLKFQITITSTADETLEDLTVKDELPSRLIYQGNLKINNESSSLNITNGINVGDLEKNETIIITFLAMVASKENFVYGSTDLINTILVYNGDTSETGICKIIVKKSSASDIPTGITNNFFLDSILFPLLSSMFLIWAFRSRLIGLDKAMDQRKKEIVKYRTEKELAKKINKIKNKII